MTLDRWLTLMTQYQLNDNAPEYEYLSKKHNEKHRAYHNVTHVKDCISKLDSLGNIKYRKEIEMAFWYHDVIYNPYGKDNELKSAESAVKFLTSEGLEESSINKVEALIISTIHKKAPQNIEEAYIMDIDISILGGGEQVYDNYTQQIRQEYKLVPSFIYRKNRLKIMEMFLNREELYFTPHFKSLYDHQARLNIAREIEKLRK